MDNKLNAIFELNRAPMLAIERGRVILANSRAEELFGSAIEGKSAVGLLPDSILANTSDNFVASAQIESVPYCISAFRSEGTLYLSLAPEHYGSSTPEFISDSLLNTMLSSLFDLGLAIDRVESETESRSDPRLESCLAILNHSYYNIRHSLLNLSSSIALRRGSLPFSFRSLDLSGLCSDLVSTVSLICRNKGLDISFSTRHGELFALADGEKVERILLNLISNSIAHTPRGGKISIALEKSGDMACFSVDDNGSGIPAAEMAELFTKYEREARQPRLDSLSTGGLGLGVARALAEGHGGALIIESREGKGTCVRVMLPLRSAQLSTLESDLETCTNSGMSMILTELSQVLDSGSYTRKFLE